MQKTTRAIALIALLIVSIASLAACAPAGQPAPTPTSAQVLILPGVNAGEATQPASQNQPAATAYVAPAEQPAQPTPAAGGSYPAPGKDYPAPQGGGQPQAVQAVENRSKVTAQLLDAVPAPNEAGRLPLHVKILASEEVQGTPSFTQKLINTDITLEVDPAGLPELKAGDTFTVMVSYQGDEKGGKYSGSEVTKP